MPLAITARELGPPESLVLADFDAGEPAAGQVRVDIACVGVSYFDVLMATGQYQVRPPVPFIPGSEAAGVIVAVGAGVDGLAAGQRVQVGAIGGLYAQTVCVPAQAVRAIPDALSFEHASVLAVSCHTAWHALVQRAALQPGETLLVLGAGGATGHAAVQVGKHMGARVIASASTPEKRALAQAGGADAVVDSASSAWREDVKAANNGRPVDVVFDPVGGETTDRAFRTLAWKGRHLVIGFLGGIAALRTNLALLKGAALIGVDIRQFALFEPELVQANLDAIFRLAGEGKLLPPIAQVYPLEQFCDAMTRAFAAQSAGRIVIRMTGS